MKWIFELDNGGSCGSFQKLIGEKNREFIFKRDGGGGFKYRGDGSPAQFTADARALFAIPSHMRPKIFITIELPEVERLTRALADQEEELTKANATIAELRLRVPEEETPAEPQPDTAEAPALAETQEQPGAEGAPSEDLGLPTGPAEDEQPAQPAAAEKPKAPRSPARPRGTSPKKGKPAKKTPTPKGRRKVAAR